MSLASRAFFAALLFAAIVPHASAQSTVSFGTTSYSFQETETTMPVRFVRSGNTSAAATLHLALRESPYPSVISHPIVMMNAGETETIINIHPFWYWYTDWDWIPNPRVYTLTIDTVDGATIGGASMATISVAEVHTPLTFTIDDVTVVEGGGPGLPSVAVFIIRRNRDDFGTLPHFVLHDGTAKAGVDYQQPASSQLPDSMEVQLKIPIIGNAAPEGDRTFTVELTNGQGPGVKSIGTCTILDDDGAIGPPVLKIEKGGKGTISVDFGSPAASSEQVTLSSLDPSIVSVPPSITIPAGASTGSAEATAGNPGGTLITATAPLSRGGRTFQIDASTYEPGALAFERNGLSVALGATSSINLKLDPAPAAPLDIPITTTNSSVALIPGSVTIGTDGNGTLNVRGIATGFTSVTATLPASRGGTIATLRIDVIVPSGLAITSLSRSSGRAAGGDSVRVFGNNLSGRCVVTFDGIPSRNATSASAGAIDAMTPPHDAGSVDVSVKCGTESFTYKNGYTYTAAPLRLTQLAPSSGTDAGGTLVRISGDNVRMSGCEAWFGDTPARTINTTQTPDLIVVAPKHVASDVNVTARCGSDTSSLGHAFMFVSADDVRAMIDTFTPASARPGDRVTITGSHFRNDDAISIGGLDAIDVATPAADTHIITVPELGAGSLSVILRDAAGRTVSGPSLTINAPASPVITKIADKILAGAELAITGSGFRRGLKYSIGPTALAPRSMTPIDATFFVPINAPIGATQFTITDGDKMVVTKNIEITASGMRANAITPQCASESGGVLATIKGAGFESGAVVQFGNAYSPDAVVQDANTIVVRVPPAFGAARPLIITIFNRSGSSATLTNAFAYASPYDGCGGGRTRASRH